jgi:hypothetical protein
LNKIIAINLISVGAIVLFCLIFFGVAGYISNRRNTEEAVRAGLQQRTQAADELLSALDWTAYTVMFSNWVQQLLLLPDNAPHGMEVAYRQNASHFLSSFASVNGDVSFVLLRGDREMLWSNNSLRYNTRYRVEDEDWFPDLEREKKWTVYGNNGLFPAQGDTWSFTRYYVVTSVYNFAPLGYLAIHADVEHLWFLIRQQSEDEEIVVTAGDVPVISSDARLDGSSSSTIGDSYSQSASLLDGQLTLTITKRFPRFTNLGSYTLFFILLIPIILFFVMMVSNLLRQNAVMDRRRRDAELDILQEKVNPHFLYNTLEIINALILEKRYDEAVRSCEILGQIYHYNLMNKKWVTVGEEITYCKQYLQLIGNKLTGIAFVWEIDERVGGFRVLKLILQPLIENAVLHGFGAKAGGNRRKDGCLTVSAAFVADMISITIMDNGVGMSQEVLAQIEHDNNEHKTKDDATGNTHIGISNVYERLLLEYGPQLSFSIDSREGYGTKITIMFPAE